MWGQTVPSPEFSLTFVDEMWNTAYDGQDGWDLRGCDVEYCIGRFEMASDRDLSMVHNLKQHLLSVTLRLCHHPANNSSAPAPTEALSKQRTRLS
jgi:hypothetical protein